MDSREYEFDSAATYFLGSATGFFPVVAGFACAPLSRAMSVGTVERTDIAVRYVERIAVALSNR